MSMQDFINQMNTEADKLTSPDSGFVSRLKIEFGLHRAFKGRKFLEFWEPVTDPAKMAEQKIALSAKIKAAGLHTGYKSEPNPGVMVFIYGPVLGGKPNYQKDKVEFVGKWQKAAYDKVVQAIIDGDLPVGQDFYGRVLSVPNPYNESLGEDGKTGKDQDGKPQFPFILVPIQKFSGAEEAQAFIDQNGASVAPAFPFSAAAKAAYDGDAAVIWALQDEVLAQLALATEGKPFNNDAANFPLPVPATPPKLKKYIADIYSLEPADIDVLQDSAPF